MLRTPSFVPSEKSRTSPSLARLPVGFYIVVVSNAMLYTNMWINIKTKRYTCVLISQLFVICLNDINKVHVVVLANDYFHN